ncbi:MAG TPA: hypothetical protein VIY08_11765 [Candidatus Nitrosocosmicus sp.]
MVGVILNSIAMIHYNEGEYEDTLYYVLQAWNILRRLNATEFQKSFTLMSSIRKASEIVEFNILEKNAARRISNLS